MLNRLNPGAIPKGQNQKASHHVPERAKMHEVHNFRAKGTVFWSVVAYIACVNSRNKSPN